MAAHRTPGRPGTPGCDGVPGLAFALVIGMIGQLDREPAAYVARTG
jgi:hypothetical protein